MNQNKKKKPDVSTMRKLTWQERWKHHCYSSTGKHEGTEKMCPHYYLHPGKRGWTIPYCKLEKCIREKEVSE